MNLRALAQGRQPPQPGSPPAVSCVAAGVLEAPSLTAGAPDEDWAVRLQSAAKRYLVAHEKQALIRGVLPHILRPRRVLPFWALRDINVSIPRGQCVCVLGPNGAGKSTLLALVAGITAPSDGRVDTRGRLTSLLSLGTGFHPELTGEENLWLNGALLGMADAQLRRQFDQIAAFAELDGFLDAPLAAYSAGMQMRLGFAVAIHADADILVIDEVMAVGDQAFQAKCLQRLRALKEAGKTLLIATHGADTLQALVDRALLLHQGRLIADGTLEHVQERYAVLTQWLAPPQEPMPPAGQAAIQIQISRHNSAVIRHQWGRRLGTGGVEIARVALLDAHERAVTRLESGQPLTVAFQCAVTQTLPDPHLGVAIFRDDYTYCYGPNTRMDGLQLRRWQPGTHDCRLRIDALNLAPGNHRVSVAVWDTEERAPHAYHYAMYPLALTGPAAAGVALLAHTWRQVPAASRDRSAPPLTAEGPRGIQAWYRTFEPLTLTAILPSSPPDPKASLRAECRGPHGELWWASRWSPPPGTSGRPASVFACVLHFPQLTLLTGRYQWTIGWEEGTPALGEAASARCTLDVLADRLDHGILFLPHTWSVRHVQ